ncbi:MAG: energy-coupling factor ABC transporter ATP-binding protein [Phycisphaerae bacterium]
MNQSAIIAQNVSFAYTDGTAALNGVDFTIHAGEKIALVGPNGAGKSTLLLALSGFVDFKGQIEIAGLQLNRANIKRIRRQMGIVFQNPDHQLFMPTVEEDVAFGPMNMGLSADEITFTVAATLEQTGTSQLAHKSAHHLSFGEKRRVAIATVLSMQPQILIMDEPSSNLDPRARRNLINLLKSMPQTLLIAGHDMEMLLEICPSTFLIDSGKIVAQGPTEKLFSDKAMMESHGLEVPGILKSRSLTVASL